MEDPIQGGQKKKSISSSFLPRVFPSKSLFSTYNESIDQRFKVSTAVLSDSKTIGGGSTKYDWLEPSRKTVVLQDGVFCMSANS